MDLKSESLKLVDMSDYTENDDFIIFLRNNFKVNIDVLENPWFYDLLIHSFDPERKYDGIIFDAHDDHWIQDDKNKFHLNLKLFDGYGDIILVAHDKLKNVSLMTSELVIDNPIIREMNSTPHKIFFYQFRKFGIPNNILQASCPRIMIETDDQNFMSNFMPQISYRFHIQYKAVHLIK
jgi:hypothetical protein